MALPGVTRAAGDAEIVGGVSTATAERRHVVECQPPPADLDAAQVTDRAVPRDDRGTVDHFDCWGSSDPRSPTDDQFERPGRIGKSPPAVRLSGLRGMARIVDRSLPRQYLFAVLGVVRSLFRVPPGGSPCVSCSLLLLRPIKIGGTSLADLLDTARAALARPLTLVPVEVADWLDDATHVASLFGEVSLGLPLRFRRAARALDPPQFGQACEAAGAVNMAVLGGESGGRLVDLTPDTDARFHTPIVLRHDWGKRALITDFVALGTP